MGKPGVTIDTVRDGYTVQHSVREVHRPTFHKCSSGSNYAGDGRSGNQ